MTDLLAAWTEALPGATEQAAVAAGRDLLARWSEPHRRYHTVAHLRAVLSIVDASNTAAEDQNAVRLAAWFHDAIYDPRRPDNEERSAQLAVTVLPFLQVPASRIEEVNRLVQLTATHNPTEGDRDGELLCDADLAILAAPPAGYDAYTRAVRDEYSHVSDADFRAGRAEVLHRLLALPVLFRLHPAWEQPARANVARELASLR